MKKILLILLLLQTSYIGFAQTDSLKKVKPKYKFGVSVGATFNLLFLLDFKNHDVGLYAENDPQYMYLNALQSNILSPNLEFSYHKNNNLHYSISIGYVKIRRTFDNGLGWDFYESSGLYRNIFLNPQIVYCKFGKHRISPFIGLGLYYSNKNIKDTVRYSNYGGSSNVIDGSNFVMKDNSNLFSLKIPVGINFGKGKWQFSVGSNLNVVGFVFGHQRQINTEIIEIMNPSHYFDYINTNELYRYSKFLSPIDLIALNVFNSIQFKLCYNFNYKS